MFRPLPALILALAIALCAPGCGLKGPLVLEQPAKKTPARTTAPAPTTTPAPTTAPESTTAPASTPPEAPAQ